MSRRPFRWLAMIVILPTITGQAQRLTKFVDPFLGTGGHGHVYPGATVPFGMVQLSPDNGVEGWDWCSGYHYSSNTIAGFSHTHLSGTGIGDWCDISVLPLADTSEARKARILIPFDHAQEKANPGYYSVKLKNGIDCEMTADTRTGHHRYRFPANEGWLRFDMGFAINWDKSTAGMLQRIDDRTIIGYRYSTGWAKGQKVYFAARFSQPITYHQFLDDSVHTTDQAFGPLAKMLLQFKQGKTLHVQVTLSSVSTEKALIELNHADRPTAFDLVRKKATSAWEKELQKIRINTKDRAFATRFYTALYRSCLAPVIHSDRDGQYQTWNGQQKKFEKGEAKYTIFSQWDVFRALSPLFTLTQTKRLPDLINSLLQRYEDDGLLPVWDISTWEANTMTGYHSIPIIADAILKDIQGFDYEKAYQAMRASAFQKQRGTPAYIEYGYVPQDKHGWSVTMTLEYAFDDWCIAQVANKLGKTEDYSLFMKRAGSYAKLFDAKTGFMRARKSDGSFIEPFDPLLSEHGFDGQYIEGTAWQHSFFVPHTVDSLAMLYGGKEKLVAKLDELFTAPSELHGDNVSIDVTGLIGQYAHGNEPSHHIIYMYTKLGYPEKAAKWIRVVADSIYKNGPDGLSGNDDCGQMSAWYLWTSLGMYPMNPTGGEYTFGFPLIENAQIQLPNGRSLKIEVKKVISEKAGIQRITWNSQEIPVRSITHTELLKGGTLIYYVAK
jgi:predicted alpha-1,2-mannosidase